MKNIVLIIIFLFCSFLMKSQTEKGMWLYSGSFEHGSFEKENSIRYGDVNIVSIKAELGKFLTRKQAVGGRLRFDYFKGGIFSNTNLDKTIEQNIFLESSAFYRYYFINIKKVSFFLESSMKVSQNRFTSNSFFSFHQFANYSGLGAAWTFENTAIEFDFSLPLFRTEVQNYAGNIYNFTLNRSLQRSNVQGLAKLEDTYLFVRNIYLGLSWSGSYDLFEIYNTEPLINIGFFLTDKWLIDFEFSGRKGLIFRGESFQSINFRIENAFFVRLNENGLYLRPAVSLEFVDGFLKIPDEFQLGLNTKNLTGNIEIVRFIGSHFMLGGGASLRTIHHQNLSNSFSFAGTGRASYFFNNNVAIEVTIAVPAYSFNILKEEGQNRIERLLAFTQIKARTFIFQK